MSESHDFLQSGIFSIEGRHYDINELTCSQISVHTHSGRSFLISGSGRDRKYGYRSGCVTDIGDILEDDWISLAKHLIERDQEQDLFEGLLEYSKTCAWLHTSKERENYALQLHMARIFDNPQWVGYQEYNRKYRPEILVK